jgi:hypothetical protein
MKSILIVFAFCLVIFAQPSKYVERTTKQSAVIGMQYPHLWFKYVDVSSTNYGVPDSVTVLEIRCLDSARVKVMTKDVTDTLHFIFAGDIYRIQVDTIYKLGTDSLSRIKRVFISGLSH